MEFLKIKKPELSETEKEIARSISEIPYMQDSNKVDMLLVWRGLKPATEIELKKQWASNEKSKELTREEISQLRNAVNRAGLYMTSPVREKEDPPPISDDVEETYGHDTVSAYIARDRRTAEQLARTNAYGEGSRVYGKLSGYPKSAIDAYVSAESRSESPDATDLLIHDYELPEEVRHNDFMAFAEFRLSRANWREEIKVAKKWAEEIRKMAPDLYQRIVSDFKDRVFNLSKKP